ncbi:NTF2 fold immunity protein [uncultured Sphingorhabdus sp.]|uniref:NTF2 fold immunity protein n=1 Tax=uncultured Sphingorhabdus sp. TaxID=1686106 RepID=UPI00262E5763|nr:NTF2 fold immunity protein [uncultured Sphingorhabdus sp.]HMS19069.1 NTF2 fold immunity protein [Sphingorhabdus sp.]
MSTLLQRVLWSLAVLQLLASCDTSSDKNSRNFLLKEFETDASDFNYSPASGYVDRPEVAVEIAEAVAARFYGRANIESQRPYLVKRVDDRWVVQGALPHSEGIKGGVFEVQISSSDGKILRLIHGK